MAISTPAFVQGLWTISVPDATLTAVPFTAGRLYLYGYQIDRAAGGPDFSGTGGNFTIGGVARTFVFVAQIQAYSTTRTLVVFRYIPAVTETGDLVYTPGGAANANFAGLIEVESGFAASPVLQTKAGSEVSGLKINIPFDALPRSDSLLVVFVGTRGNSNVVDPQIAFTELSDTLGTGSAGQSGTLETQYAATPEPVAGAGTASGFRNWGLVAVEIEAMHQVIVPIADVAAGSWTTDTGATTGLALTVDEPDPANDADYIKSSLTPVADLVKLQLGDPGIPDAGSWTLSVRHKKV